MHEIHTAPYETKKRPQTKRLHHFCALGAPGWVLIWDQQAPFPRRRMKFNALWPMLDLARTSMGQSPFRTALLVLLYTPRTAGARSLGHRRVTRLRGRAVSVADAAVAVSSSAARRRSMLERKEDMCSAVGGAAMAGTGSVPPAIPSGGTHTSTSVLVGGGCRGRTSSPRGCVWVGCYDEK